MKSVPINPPPQVNKQIPQSSKNIQSQKSIEEKKIDSLRQEKDLIDLTAIKQTNNNKQEKDNKEQKVMIIRVFLCRYWRRTRKTLKLRRS